jgi:type IV pilus assembly protein PilN
VIRINLLGRDTEKQGSRFGGFSLGEMDASINQIGMGALFVVVLLSIAGAWWYQSRQLSGLRAENAAIELERAQLQEVAGQVDSIRDRTDLLRQKLDVIVELKVNQTGPVMMLDQVSRAITDGLWLTRLELEDRSVTIRGAALSEVAVADFVNALERSEYFNAVRLRTLGDTGEAQNFQITLDFVPSPVRPGAAPVADSEEAA